MFLVTIVMLCAVYREKIIFLKIEIISFNYFHSPSRSKEL